MTPSGRWARDNQTQSSKLESSRWRRRRSMLRIPPVLDLNHGFDFVALQEDFAGGFFNADADGLSARFRRASVADEVVFENEVFSFAAHANARGFAFET